MSYTFKEHNFEMELTDNVEKFKERALQTIKDTGLSFEPYGADTPIEVKIRIYRKPPNKTKWYKESCLAGFIFPAKGNISPSKVASTVLEGLEGVAYKSHTQVCIIDCGQRYDVKEWVSVKVTAIYQNFGDIKTRYLLLKNQGDVWGDMMKNHHELHFNKI